VIFLDIGRSIRSAHCLTWFRAGDCTPEAIAVMALRSQRIVDAVLSDPVVAAVITSVVVCIASKGASLMNLQIRDPRAHKLARQLAEKRHVSLTEAVIEALEAQLRAENTRVPLAERLKDISGRLRAKGAGGGHEMTKDDIDEMWGHS